ncbi:hypothetical protein J3459_016589 [Metarhizium acridum]|uniref:uncharacterized protein n=1 Tax=Metarhizium acridum TaxID=92637 RepID=UPI001C6AC72C|nr:hypothetical protein J3459_016589 [Metarhizium acridum]KAG8413433.1 hypothetical protein J3458_012992 [Metarhizium acridum]
MHRTARMATRTLKPSILVAFLTAVSLVYMTTFHSSSSWSWPGECAATPRPHKPSLASVPPDIKPFDRRQCRLNETRFAELKERYELQDDFKYAKRLVQFSRDSQTRRESLTKLSQPLFPFSSARRNWPLQRSRFDPETDWCSDPIEVNVSASNFPQNADASAFIFGVSTTHHRFEEYHTLLINDWAYWLTDGAGRSNGGTLLLTLSEATEEQIQEAQRLLRQAGIDAHVQASIASPEMAVRYLSLVPAMVSHPKRLGKRWLVLCDDDTFFPYMHSLTQKLAGFDHTEEIYIGALSEEVYAVLRHGPQAFGGAGVFLSLRTAERVATLFHECSSADKVKEAEEQGDRLLHQCISRNPDVVLTALQDLWQLDFSGDAAGFYEWGRRPLSLHHYRSWHNAVPGQLATIAYACGEDCILQRFQTKDDYIISGYSIASYPRGISFAAHQIESTFRSVYTNEGGNFDYKFGPQRPSLLGTGRKNAWELREATRQTDGSILQTYVRKGNDPRWVDKDNVPIDGHDGVIELLWTSAGLTH